MSGTETGVAQTANAVAVQALPLFAADRGLRKAVWQPAGRAGVDVVALGLGGLEGILISRGMPVAIAVIVPCLTLAVMALVGLSVRDRWPAQDLLLWADQIERVRWAARIGRPRPVSFREIEAFLAEHPGDGHDNARVIMLCFVGRLDQARAELGGLTADSSLQAWRLAYADGLLGVLEGRPLDQDALSLALEQLDEGPDRRFARAQIGLLEATAEFRDRGDWLQTLAATAAVVAPRPPRERLLWLWSWRFYALDFFMGTLVLGILAGLAGF